jgi:hypothetical protein
MCVCCAVALHEYSLSMLAFDIETMGLCSIKNHITVAAIYDLDEGTNLVFRFVTKDHENPPYGVRYIDNVGDRIEEFLSRLDDATSLTAFNGIQFDIPFIQQQFKVPDARVQAWVLKTYDTFEFSRRVFNRTFPLNMLLSMNGFEVKSGDGAQAVRFAEASNWKELESYCADDSRLTWDVAQKKRLILPEGPTFRKRTLTNFDPNKALCLYITDSDASVSSSSDGRARSQITFAYETIDVQ